MLQRRENLNSRTRNHPAQDRPEEMSIVKRLVRLLVVDSARELFRYKSFFLLIFVLILADRGLKRLVDARKGLPPLPDMHELGVSTAQYLFEELPGEVLRWVTDYRTFIVIAALFLLKQLISMWPSSDMRRMHRQERERFGLIRSLISLRWDQVLWDAIAVGTLCGLTLLWALVVFAVSRTFWELSGSLAALVLFLVLLGAVFPVVMGGFSYSSKLAVLSRGSFREKLILFFRLFTDRKVFTASWLFFLARIGIEALFVVAIPTVVLMVVDNYGLRILLAGLIATPVYSYLKMASFKFFLEVYRHAPLVRAEYSEYFMSGSQFDRDRPV